MYCTQCIHLLYMAHCIIRYTLQETFYYTELIQYTNIILHLQFNLRDVLLYIIFALHSPPKNLMPM